MKSVGIIGEYNPFHQGHKYLIEKAVKQTEADVCISVMSGNFTQRGMPAVDDKWDRAQEAVKNGINLVVELPTIYACNSAEYFAKGGIEVLEGFGAIDYLAFGSENGELSELKSAADFLIRNDEHLTSRIRELNKQGMSYPRARQVAAVEIDPDFDESIVKEPNNILAIEYLKHIKNMEPITIKRRGYGYHQSATILREQMMEDEPERFDKMQRTYFELIGAKILQTKGEVLEGIFSSGEGLGNKLKNEIRYVNTTEQLIDRIKSKAYTYTRISRLLTQVLLDIDDATIKNASNYIRILALDEIGAKFIKDVKKKECATLPIITNINKELKDNPEIVQTMEKDILASDMYNIISKKDLYDYSDYIQSPYIKL